MKMEQSVPKRRHIKFRRRGITQKKTYNVQNTAKVLNQESNDVVWSTEGNLAIKNALYNVGRQFTPLFLNIWVITQISFAKIFGVSCEKFHESIYCLLTVLE
jgi:hypothetical protein